MIIWKGEQLRLSDEPIHQMANCALFTIDEQNTRVLFQTNRRSDWFCPERVQIFTNANELYETHELVGTFSERTNYQEFRLHKVEENVGDAESRGVPMDSSCNG